MPVSPTIAQRTAVRNARIAEGLTQGWTHATIGDQLGISGPAVTQAIRKYPDLRRLQTRTPRSQPHRLRAYRNELRQLRVQTLSLARDVRRELRALDEELQAATIDRLLGLRP